MDLQEFKKMSKEEQLQFDFKETMIDECVDKKSIYEDRVKEVREKIYYEKNPISRLKEWKFYKFIIPTEEEKGKLKSCYSFDDKIVKGIGHDCDTTELSLQIINQYLFNGKGVVRYFDRSENKVGRLDFRRELVICENNNYKLLEKRNKKNCEYYMGDTMNSFQTIASVALYKIIKSEYIDEYPVYGKYTIITLEKLYRIENLNEVLVDEKKAIEIFNGLIRLAKLTHTMGNFIAVPSKVFNVPRSRKTKDFFDLTLEGIRQYYLKEKHTPLCELWNKYRNIQWLDKYKMENDVTGEKSWQNFINYNLLNDYIYEEGDKYMIKSLFKGHSFNKLMPNKLEEFADCINNMCEMIELRSDRIYNSIKYMG